jgi:hypothetical protein
MEFFTAALIAPINKEYRKWQIEPKTRRFRLFAGPKLLLLKGHENAGSTDRCGIRVF